MASITRYGDLFWGKGISENPHLLSSESFLKSPLGREIQLNLCVSERVPGRTAIIYEVFKEAVLMGLTISARIPYYKMCELLFPSVPGLGAFVGVTGAILPWGTIINSFFHRLIDEWGMRSRLADPEERLSYGREISKAALALLWSIAAESYSFAIIYLTTRRIDLVALSAISIAIPAHSCNSSINWAITMMTASPEKRNLLNIQETWQRQLRNFSSHIAAQNEVELALFANRMKELQTDSSDLQDVLRTCLTYVRRTQESPKTKCEKISEAIATALGFLLAAVYLAWVGFLTYEGWKSFPISNHDAKEGLAVTCAILGGLANAYFMIVGMVDLCRTSVSHFCHKRGAISLSNRYYPRSSTVMKVTIAFTCAMAFGPSTVISMQYLPPILGIISSVLMSSASVLSPVEPMSDTADLIISRLGRNSKTPAVSDIFQMKKQLERLQLALSAASSKDIERLQKFMAVEDSLEAPLSADKGDHNIELASETIQFA